MAVLPDVLEFGLEIVFCGTAAGEKSAQAGAYYAGPGNRFWDVIYRVGLTPWRCQPHAFRSLVRCGIGFTDLAKHRAGADSTLTRSDFDVTALRAKIAYYQPRVLAFNGKRAGQEFIYPRKIEYGLQSIPVGSTHIVVLPSTSGAARGFWDESHWVALAAFAKGERPRGAASRWQSHT